MDGGEDKDDVELLYLNILYVIHLNERNVHFINEMFMLKYTKHLISIHSIFFYFIYITQQRSSAEWEVPGCSFSADR